MLACHYSWWVTPSSQLHEWDLLRILRFYTMWIKTSTTRQQLWRFCTRNLVNPLVLNFDISVHSLKHSKQKKIFVKLTFSVNYNSRQTLPWISQKYVLYVSILFTRRQELYRMDLDNADWIPQVIQARRVILPTPKRASINDKDTTSCYITLSSCLSCNNTYVMQTFVSTLCSLYVKKRVTISNIILECVTLCSGLSIFGFGRGSRNYTKFWWLHCCYEITILMLNILLSVQHLRFQINFFVVHDLLRTRA